MIYDIIKQTDDIEATPTFLGILSPRGPRKRGIGGENGCSQHGWT